MYRSLLISLGSSSSAEQALPPGTTRRAGVGLELVSIQMPFPPIYGEGTAGLGNPLEPRKA